MDAMVVKPKLFPVAQAKLIKNSPEILVGVGIVGVIASTVLACRATLKAPAAIEAAKGKYGNIKGAVEAAKDDPNLYTEKDRREDMVKLGVQTAWDFTKLYGVPSVLMVGSLFCILKGHGITMKRNAALTSALTSISAGYKAYRGRVRDRFGEEVEQDIYLDRREETEEYTDENGKTKTRKVTKCGLPIDYSGYARYFDEASPHWHSTPEMNLMFLKNIQSYMNDRLHINKVVFLNEVYEELGIPKSQAGQVVGWSMNSEAGDHFIDFGLANGNQEMVRRFVNGDEPSIHLDFNVDGPVIDAL